MTRPPRYKPAPRPAGRRFTPRPLPTSTARQRRGRQSSTANTISAGVVLGLLLAAIIGIGAWQWVFSGRIYPHVSVGGVSLDGQSFSQAAATLAHQQAVWEAAPIVLQVHSIGSTSVIQQWSVTSRQFGVHYDSATALRTAQATGHSGSFLQRVSDQLGALTGGQTITVPTSIDRAAVNTFLTALVPQLRQFPTSARIGLENGQVVLTQTSHPGQQMDVAGALTNLLAALSQPHASAQSVDIPTRLVVSAISDQVAQAAISRVRPMLAQPLVLTYGNTGTRWVLSPTSLAHLLTFAPRQNTDGTWSDTVGINTTKLGQALTGVAKTIYRPPHNAGFILDPTHPANLGISPSLPGTALDVGATGAAILAQITNPTHTIYLPTQLVPAPIDANAALTEGFDTVVGETSLSLAGASQEHLHNAAQAATRLDNLILAAGQTITISQAIGPLSGKGNYYPELTSLGTTSITSPGGGISAVASALYNAALAAGLDISGTLQQPIFDPALGPLGSTLLIAPRHGGGDLILHNSGTHSILIKTYLNTTTQALTIYIYNHSTTALTVTLSPPTLSITPDGGITVSQTRSVAGQSTPEILTMHYSPLEAP